MAYCKNSINGGFPFIFDAPNFLWTEKYAYGGQITTDASGYIYHTFTDPSIIYTFTLLKDVDASVLVVAGGAGGPGVTAGTDYTMKKGGGGGEVKEVNLHLNRGKYLITVGYGGLGGVPTLNYGNKGKGGGNSSFGGIIDASGAPQDSYSSSELIQDASKGNYSGNANRGGYSGTKTITWYGGGGGSGGAGIDVEQYMFQYDPCLGSWQFPEGDISCGGPGVRSEITGSWYGGGGGSSLNQNNVKFIGGIGGGGNGWMGQIFGGVQGTDGGENTGGGAGTVGANEYVPGPINGKHGGSGIVVVRIKF